MPQTQSLFAPESTVVTGVDTRGGPSVSPPAPIGGGGDGGGPHAQGSTVDVSEAFTVVQAKLPFTDGAESQRARLLRAGAAIGKHPFSILADRERATAAYQQWLHSVT